MRNVRKNELFSVDELYRLLNEIQFHSDVFGVSKEDMHDYKINVDTFESSEEGIEIKIDKRNKIIHIFKATYPYEDAPEENPIVKTEETDD